MLYIQEDSNSKESATIAQVSQNPDNNEYILSRNNLKVCFDNEIINFTELTKVIFCKFIYFENNKMRNIIIVGGIGALLCIGGIIYFSIYTHKRNKKKKFT